jgi:hypothetical protein
MALRTRSSCECHEKNRQTSDQPLVEHRRWALALPAQRAGLPASLRRESPDAFADPDHSGGSEEVCLSRPISSFRAASGACSTPGPAPVYAAPLSQDLERSFSKANHVSAFPESGCKSLLFQSFNRIMPAVGGGGDSAEGAVRSAQGRYSAKVRNNVKCEGVRRRDRSVNLCAGGIRGIWWAVAACVVGVAWAPRPLPQAEVSLSAAQIVVVQEKRVIGTILHSRWRLHLRLPPRQLRPDSAPRPGDADRCYRVGRDA